LAPSKTRKRRSSFIDDSDTMTRNLDHVTAFVCKLAQQFDLKGKWGFHGLTSLNLVGAQ
jgi:hypothetical protein